MWFHRFINGRSAACEAAARCLAVCEAVDHQADGEVEAVVAGSGGEFGGVALGVGEGAGQSGVPAQQFVAADDPAAVAVATLLVHQGDLEAVGVDVKRQGVDRPGGGLRVDASGEQDGEHSLDDAQRVQIGRSDGKGRPGDSGIAQVLVAQLGADADDLLPPGGGIGLGQIDGGNGIQKMTQNGYNTRSEWVGCAARDLNPEPAD